MNTRTSRKFTWPIALTLICITAAGTFVFVFLRLETWPARTFKQGTSELERVGRELRDAVAEVTRLQPRVTINNRVYLEKTTAAAELTILTRQIEVEHELLHTWAGSTKKIKLHGSFTAKAGFDLQQDVTVDVRPDEITIRIPHASILGVEQNQIEILAFENGFWNRISPTDLETELARLPDLARSKAKESGILPEAEAALRKQLEERVHSARPLRIQFQEAANKG